MRLTPEVYLVDGGGELAMIDALKDVLVTYGHLDQRPEGMK